MPRIDLDSENMDSSACLKDSPDKVVCPETALVPDYPHTFGTAYGMLHSYPERRHFPVVFFFFPL
jgi:hypothetical protein